MGVGWAKTGTKTLGECLHHLGYRHQSTRLDLVEHLERGQLEPLFAIADAHDSFEDWPWLLLFRELDERYPGSRFILTVRDSRRWLRSYRNMLERQGPAPADRNRRRRVLYGLPFPDVTDEQLLQRYERHNREVQGWFADRPGQLLVVNWETGAGWRELCRFLGRRVPDVPFPHANQGSFASHG